MNSKELDQLANGIEQGFMQRGGWKACRYLLGKLADKVEHLQAIVDKLPSGQKTKDGVPKSPNDIVYYTYGPTVGLPLRVVGFRNWTQDADGNWLAFAEGRYDEKYMFLYVHDCYSTFEAAEAAREEAGP